MRSSEILRALLFYSSIPLALTSYLYLVSGYGLAKPWVVDKLSLGLLSYRTSVLIHVHRPVRIAMIVLASIHGFSGFWLMTYRAKSAVLRSILRVAILALTIAALTLVAMIEILS